MRLYGVSARVLCSECRMPGPTARVVEDDEKPHRHLTFGVKHLARNRAGMNGWTIEEDRILCIKCAQEKG